VTTPKNWSLLPTTQFAQQPGTGTLLILRLVRQADPNAFTARVEAALADRLKAGIASARKGTTAAQRLTRLEQELGEATRRAGIAEARIGELAGKRKQLELAAAPGVARQLASLAKEAAVAETEKAEALEAIATIRPLLSTATAERDTIIDHAIATARESLAADRRRAVETLLAAAAEALDGLLLVEALAGLSAIEQALRPRVIALLKVDAAA
jgi:hypothetical protein